MRMQNIFQGQTVGLWMWKEKKEKHLDAEISTILVFLCVMQEGKGVRKWDK